MYYLWLNNAQSGPYSLEQLQSPTVKGDDQPDSFRLNQPPDAISLQT